MSHHHLMCMVLCQTFVMGNEGTFGLYWESEANYIYIYIYIYIIHTHILHNIETLVGQKEIKRIGTAVNAACHFGHACHRFVNVGPVNSRGLYHLSAFPQMAQRFQCEAITNLLSVLRFRMSRNIPPLPSPWIPHNLVIKNSDFFMSNL